MTSTVSSYQPERDSLVTTEASGNPHTDIHYDLVSFLSVAQQFNIDFLPVMWNALEPFGKGGTADINESVVNIKTNFAFKRTSRLFKRKKRDENTFRALISEVFILATPSIRSHPNIVDLEGICWEIVDDDENMSPVLVFLKSEKGDLGQYLCSADGTQSSFDTRLNICLDIGRAIAVLHSGNIVHGDIKPQNILVFMDQDGLPIAKVTDFGYSCLGTTEEDYVQLPVTRGWNAPECLVNSRLKLKDAKKADVYSFGLVCLHTLFRKTEFQTISILSEVRQLLLGTPGFSITQKASLWAFFQSTLSDPDSRNTDFETLMTRLQGASTAATIPSLSNFNVSGKVSLGGGLGLMPSLALSEAGATGARLCKPQTASTTLETADNLVHAMDHYPAAPDDLSSGASVQFKPIETAGGQTTLCSVANAEGRIDAVAGEVLEEVEAFEQACAKAMMPLGKKEGSIVIQSFNPDLNGLRHANFHLAEAVLDLCNFDQRVRIQIRRAIEARADNVTANCKCRSKAAFQLAFCFRLGFGLPADKAQSSRWLKRSEETMDALDGDIEIIKNKNEFPSIHSSKAIRDLTSQQQSWASLMLEIEYLKRTPMEDIVASYNREILDMEESLGNHMAVLLLKEVLANTYDHYGEFNKAEPLQKELVHRYMELPVERSQGSLRLLNSLASTYSNQGRWNEAEELKVQVMEEMKRVFGQEHSDTLTSMGNLASTYRSQGRWNEAEELGVEVMEAMKRVLGQEHPKTLASMGNLASTYWNQGRWKEAEALEVEVMETRKRVLGQEHPDTLNSMGNLALTYINQGRWKEAEELGVEVTEARKRVFGQEHPDTLTSMANLASTYINQGRWKEAEALEVQVMEASKRVLGQEHPDTLTSMANLALTYNDQGRWKEDEALGVEVMETRKRVLGQEHPDTLTSMGNLASTYRSQGRWKEAKELGVQVMEASKRVLGQEHSGTLTSMHNLALTYWNQGRWNEAEALGVEAMETRKRVLGQEHPDTLNSMVNLELMNRKQGRWDEAEALGVEVVEASKRVFGQEHPDTLTSMHNLASTYINQERWNEAEELGVEVMEMRKRVLGQEHPHTLPSMANLALTYSNQGRWNEAEELGVEVTETMKRVLGREHPDTLTSMHNLALTYWKQGRWKEVDALEVQVVEARKRVFGQAHPDTLDSMSGLASTYWKQGRCTEAVALQIQMVHSSQTVLGENHISTVNAITNLTKMLETSAASRPPPDTPGTADTPPQLSPQLSGRLLRVAISRSLDESEERPPQALGGLLPNSGESDETETEEERLQRALAMSMEADSDTETDEEMLQRALAMSMEVDDDIETEVPAFEQRRGEAVKNNGGQQPT